MKTLTAMGFLIVGAFLGNVPGHADVNALCSLLVCCFAAVCVQLGRE